jgi:hypothetical protein
MAAMTNGVYINTSSSTSSPMSASHNFAANYDMDSPMAAATSYARSMHQHTKRQMDAATRSSRRRAGDANDVGRTLSSAGTDGSMDSRRSSE